MSDLRPVIQRLRTQTTVSMADACAALGFSVNRGYLAARDGRELAPGVRAIRVGEHKVVVPARPLARCLGLLDEED